ncbi:MAG: S41 family peptidase [Telluria sp.]
MVRNVILAALLAVFSSTSFAEGAASAEALEARLFNSPALAGAYQENISEDEKVAGLSKFWSEVKYNFVYVDKLKQIDWDQLYLDYIPKVRATQSTAQYYRVMSELCAKLGDGHTNVYPAKEVWDSHLARPLIRTHLVEGKVLVREVLDDSLRAKGVAPGVEIVAVDGEPSIAYGQREVAPYQSASTRHDLDVRTYSYSFLSGPIDKRPVLTFRDAKGKTFDLEVQRHGMEGIMKVLTPRTPFEFRMLAGDVAYVALNSFANDEAADKFLAAFKDIAKSTALLIDLRNNGGGNSNVGFRVLATLTGKAFQTGKWDTRNYLPTYRAWGRAMPNFAKVSDDWQPDPAHQYGKPVAVLTSAATYSAAEDFAVAFDAMKRGVIVGEATGGSTGQPLMIKLPGGGSARIVSKRDVYPDGREFVGVGIQPGIKVSPTVADLRKGRDTVLEAALLAVKK